MKLLGERRVLHNHVAIALFVLMLLHAGTCTMVDEDETYPFVYVYVITCIAFICLCGDSNMDKYPIREYLGGNTFLKVWGLLCIIALVVMDSILAHEASGTLMAYSVVMAVISVIVLLLVMLNRYQGKSKGVLKWCDILPVCVFDSSPDLQQL